jgi:feruloyl-CoA synthase
MTALGKTETFSPPDTAIERRPDGTIMLSSRHPLPAFKSSIPAVLRERAAAHPERPFASERDDEHGWTSLTYGAARANADALAQSLLDLGLGPDRPVMILSGNSIAHLVVSLGAYTAGVPVMPISVAYSLMSDDHARIGSIAELTRPGLLFADDAQQFSAALDALAPSVGATLVATTCSPPIPAPRSPRRSPASAPTRP